MIRKMDQNKHQKCARHFKALMRKNFIQWKRTPLTSSVELIVVVFLSLYLAYWSLSSILNVDSPQFIDYRAAVYPTAVIDNKTGNWTSSYLTTQLLGQDLKPFMQWANLTADPMSDYKSPFWLLPYSCYQSKSQLYPDLPWQPFSSPLIGYIRNNSTIQQDIIEQLNLIFSSQKNITDVLQNLFQSGQAEQMGMNKSEVPLFDYFRINRTTFKPDTDYGPGEFTFQGFDSMDQYIKYIKSNDYGTKLHPAICFGFTVNEFANNNYELELMFADTNGKWDQKIQYQGIVQFEQARFSSDIWNYNRPQQYGFHLLQNLGASTILKRKTGVNNATILNMFVPHQANNKTQISNFWQFDQYGQLFILVMWVPLVYSTVYKIVLEKQKKMQETMLIMGMSEIAYWGSWYAYYTIISTIISLVAFMILQTCCFSNSQPLILLALLWGFGQSIFSQILVIQTLFKDARWASIFTTVFYFSFTQVQFALNWQGKRTLKLILCCCSPGICMAQTFRTFLQWDGIADGCDFVKWNFQLYDLSVKEGLLILYLSTLGWMLIGIALENIIPKSYGVRKQCFPDFITKFCKHKISKKNPVLSFMVNENRTFDTKYLSEDCFESVTQEVVDMETIDLYLKISDLFKTYDDGFQAVNGINLKLYQDQIFVLLGHNGAGKTTTLSILSGLLPRSLGFASIYGVDLFNKMEEVRKFTGVCPQYDVLFDLLTPEEHLDFFYEMKGASEDQESKKAEIEKLLVDVGVDDKRNAMAQTLSGGNKRKLSVAIALIGGSKFLIFDEPTAGMDLNARRHLWEMFKVYKKGRIILMSTHYMDEADILGDRIAIMTKGKISCLGTSIFLKKKFGTGYNMAIVKDSVQKNKLVMPYLIENLGPLVVKQSEIQSEMTVKIDEIYSSKFNTFFEAFDKDLSKLQIRNYGISISTLEEVFMKIGHIQNLSQYTQNIKIKAQTQKTEQKRNCVELKKDQKCIEQPGTELNERADSFVQELHPDTEILEPDQINFSLGQNVKDIDSSFKNNLRAVLYKRLKMYKNVRLALLFEFIVPVFLAVIGICLTMVADEFPDSLPQIFNVSPNSQIPQGTQIMVNSKFQGPSNIPIGSLIQNLPASNFTIKLNKNLTDQSNIYSYDNATFKFGLNTSSTPPWHYGDYFLWSANNKTKNFKFLTWVNTTAAGSSEMYPAMMYESILKTATGDPNFQFKIKVSCPPKHYQGKNDVFDRGVLVLQYGFGCVFGIMLSSIVGSLVVERTSGKKHLQILSGLQLPAYWIGNFIVDAIKLEIVLLLQVITMWIVGYEWIPVSIIFPLAPLSVLPFAYTLSMIFYNENLAYLVTMMCIWFVNGLIAMETWNNRWQSGQEVKGDILNWVYQLIPTYVFSCATFTESQGWKLAINRKYFQTDGGGMKLSQNSWDFNHQSGVIFMIIVDSIIWTGTLVLIERGVFSCKCKNKTAITQVDQSEPDQDVEEEKKRIAQGCDDQIIVQNFSKEFTTMEHKKCKQTRFFGVNNLTFALKTGECFALLGVNGAGKSTTFKSLTNEITKSQGSIKIGGFDLDTNFEDARKLIGYCPQYNLIFESLSVLEQLTYYAMVKGIPESFRQMLVNQTIQKLGLSKLQHKQVSSLSGGNQRKVCVAVAIVGNPPIILLDEPSAGMDPEARRFMWDVIAQITEKRQSAIVLTSHSMEEAEALSTKMGIMVKGGIFKCYGSTQHIRNKFGTGYVMEIKIRTLNESEIEDQSSKYLDNSVLNPSTSKFLPEEIREDLNKLVLLKSSMTEKTMFIHSQVNLYRSIFELCNTFETVELLEKYGNYIRVRVQRRECTVGRAFGLIENLKGTLEISEYSVSQTTLEQIFQNFADVHYQENIKIFKVVDDCLTLS